MNKKTVVIGRVGLYCGSIHLTPDKAWVTDNAFYYILPEHIVNQKFLIWLLRSTNLQYNTRSIAQPVISGRKIYPLLVPLPPTNEQKHIVSKVDELMTLCDELEARKQKVSINCIRLNDASIHKLLTAREPTKFSKHWQRICDNFHLLDSKPENVNKLRKAILQLAVQGKLVPQDPKDEPASVLLKKIKAEKDRLIKEGKIKKPKPSPPITADEMPHKLPVGWEWVKLGILCETITKGLSLKRQGVNYVDSTKAGYARNPKREKTTGTKNSEELHWMPIIRPVKKFSCFFLTGVDFQIILT